MFESLSTSLSTLGEFHFLRPWWLAALMPAMVLSWLLFRHRQTAGSWETVIQADLLPFLLDGEGQQLQQRYFLWALIFWLLLSLALAGPSWTKIPLPIHKQQNPLVVLLDLSPSMLAEDLKPNRLTRAQYKLTDFLGKRKEGTTALIAYADDAHVVTPLTDDSATIISLVPALHPNIMPSAGSNPIVALNKAMEIIFQAGHQGGDLLLISDGITSSDAQGITSLLSSMGGFRLSVLALGSDDGAPIPSPSGGFVKDRRGDIVIAQLTSKRLKRVARENNGHYARLSADDDDLDYLISGIEQAPDSETQQLDRTFDTWQDNGFWLCFLVLPLIFLGFRRNIIIVLVLVPTLFYSESSLAKPWTELGWKDLWQTADQQGQQAFDSGSTDIAEESFQNANWKGAAAYRNENYDAATEAFTNDSSATGRYNRANSLAKTGQLEQALQAYDEVLTTEPDHEDATFNRQLVEQLLKQEQEQKKQQEQNQENQENKKDQEQSQEPEEEQQDEQSDDQDEQQNSEQNSEQNQQQKDQQSEEQNEKKEQKEQQNTDPEQSKAEQEPQASDSKPPQDDLSNEQRQAMEQWLRRVPDDPGGLLRRKFAYETWLKKQSGEQSTSQQEKQRW